MPRGVDHVKAVSAHYKHVPVLKEAIHLRRWERAIVKERRGQVMVPGLDLYFVCFVDVQCSIALPAHQRHGGEMVPVPVGGQDLLYVFRLITESPQIPCERWVAFAATTVDEQGFVTGDEVSVGVPRMGDLPARHQF